MVQPPTAFVSYSWDDDDHKGWVRDLAARLRHDGVDVRLDQWETVPGDQLPAYMERAIREIQYVLIICTPRYRSRSEKRQGGVGYEGDIMTGEVHNSANHRKFIPILRTGAWTKAAPSWLAGKYYVDLTGHPYAERAYADLLTTILGTRPKPPPVGQPPGAPVTPAERSPRRSQQSPTPSLEVKIIGVAIDEVTEPRLDGSRGSALYTVPFRLNRKPSRQWAEAFVATWNRPPRFTTMHRPGIARVRGDRIILDGTTIEEVERYHRDTLVLCAQRANELLAELDAKQSPEEERGQLDSQQHRRTVEDVAKRLRFDD